MSRRVALRVSLLALGLAGLAACAPPSPPNLLLVVADTLRADALRCDGPDPETPHLCALAARGARFERAYASAPWTPPSSVALFTGSYPSGHAEAPVAKRSRFFYVGEARWRLGDALRQRGYDARSHVENDLVRRSDVLRGLTPLSAKGKDEVAGFAIPTDDARHRWMAGPIAFLMEAQPPFALLVWTLDPHAPYVPTEPQLEALGDAARDLPHPVAWYTELGHKEAPRRIRVEAPRMDDRERAFLRRLYQLEVASVDERIGYLLAVLGERGLLDHTLVVVTSDHGEGFGEGGVWLHGKTLQEELVRVPLLVAGPGVEAGLGVRAPVAGVDLAPTLCELLALACPAPFQGASFAGLLGAGEGADDGDERSVYLGQSNAPSHGVDALVAEGYKLVLHADGTARLHDLASPSGETRDVAAAEPERVARMRDAVLELREENERRRRANLSALEGAREGAAQEEALRALGYVE